MSKHTTRDALRMAGHLLEDEKRRTTGTATVDANDHDVGGTGYAGACRWCLVGAIDMCCQALGVDYDAAIYEAEALLSTTDPVALWDRAPSDQEAAPFVCPGCYAVGEEPCAPNCIDNRIEEEREERRRRTEECQCGMCRYCDDGQPHRGDRE